MAVTTLAFAAWADTKAKFVKSWQDASILDMNENVTLPYLGIRTNMRTWSGIITTPDPDNSELSLLVPGWHTNVWVHGPLVAEMTAGLEQHENDGVTLKNILDRTHAVQLFGLSKKAKGASTNFPAGRESSASVVYCDIRDFNTPSNVRA